MNVLVTGALGFIGSHLSDKLIAQGHRVWGIDDLSGNVVDSIEGMSYCADSDVRLHLSVFAAPVDLVVHCASPVGAVALLGRQSIVSEIVETTQAVLRFCMARKVPLINISSSEVYGFSGVYAETDACVVPYRLSHRIQYAAGKLAAEHLVRTSRVPSVTVRPFNVAGPRQSREKGFVLPTFVEQALAGEPLTVFGGAQQRSFTGVWDVVDFITQAEPLGSSVFNVGNPANRTTVYDLAHRVNIVLGTSSPIEITDGKTVHGPDYEEAEGVVKVPDITRAQNIGWAPKVGLDEMIIKTAEEVEAWRTSTQPSAT